MVINIISCKYGYYLSNVLKYILVKEGYKVNIQEFINLTSEDLHIILFSQKIKKYPKNYIIYNLEQKDISKWIDKKFELSILFSKRSWDYNQLNILKFDNLLKKKLTYFQLPCIDYSLIDYSESPVTSFDILFYGTMNKKRENILNFIRSKLDYKYKIKIINNKFGKSLFDYIRKCKIVLNISFYNNALLECYRINEVQSCKKLVISLYENKEDMIHYNYYKSSIIFVNSVNELINNIVIYLENKEKYTEKINNIKFINNTKFIHDML